MSAAFRDAEVRAALSLPGQGETTYTGVCTDTRALAPGALFVALTGERFDGHDYLEAARTAGATGAVVREDTPDMAGLVLYRVPDPLRALGRLGRAARERTVGPVIAITGQNGKTSTKEMVAAALGTRFRTHRTRANLNNLIGVPMTILEAPADVEALVVEAGANQPGEIARYREIIHPDIAVVLNAGAGHLEGFGSVEGVVREKLSLTEGVPLAVVGVVPPYLPDRARGKAERVITAGLADAERVPERVEVNREGQPVITVDGRTFTLGARGRHQAGNAMFAWAIAKELGLDLDQVAAALGAIVIPGRRGALSELAGLTVLDDCYNANPQSFATTMALAGELRKGRRLVFIAGSMRELGEHSAELHAQVADQLAELAPEVLGLVGDFVPAFRRHRARFAGEILEGVDPLELGPRLAPRLQAGDLVVLKASRGVALERILPFIAPSSESPA